MVETITAEIIPGKSITRFHLFSEDRVPTPSFSEVHASHHPNGDISAEPQYYLHRKIFPNYDKIFKYEFKIPDNDWNVISMLLANFRWVRYVHGGSGVSSYIYVDYLVIFGDNKWPVTYFGREACRI